MKCFLASLPFIVLAGCGSNDTHPSTQATDLPKKIVPRSDVQDILGALLGDGFQLSAWRSTERPVFVFDEHIPSSGLFTDQESKDFVEDTNKKVDEISSALASMAESLNGINEQPTQPDAINWLVIKYRKSATSPFLLAIRVWNSQHSVQGPIGPTKKFVDDAYTRAKREKDVRRSDDVLKYRLDYSESDRIF